MAKPTSPKWYIWSVKPDKLEIVQGYIRGKVSEVARLVCPSETKEKLLKSGKIKKRTTSIYGGYIFLRYTEESNTSDVYHKLKSNPFIVSFVGSCTESELVSVYKVQAGKDGESN